MSPNRTDTPALSLARLVLATIMFLFLWIHWGWGIAIAAALVMIATGVQGEQRSVFVPVPGIVRVLVELLYFLLGLIAVFAILGKIWEIAITVLVLILLALNAKRYQFLISLR